MFVLENSSVYRNTIVDKSFKFAVRIVNLYKYLVKKDKSLYAIYNQLLRSGNSIGANVSESQAAASLKDFTNKLSISLKESYETNYWLQILYGSDILEEREFESLSADIKELIRLLVSIIKTSKEKLRKL
jgi:four helix bundle protein